MFPLRSVIVPGLQVPLTVFEDRYRALGEARDASQKTFHARIEY